MRDENEIEIKKTRFEPNYEDECVTCGHVPTVNKTKLCGACFFGEADCIHPENW